jgi:Family of unknown function (DUF6567)
LTTTKRDQRNTKEEIVMRVKLILLLTTLVIVLFTIGCAGNGMYLASNETNVNLEQANYKIVATNITGHSSAGYLMGVSFSMGSFTQTMALGRVSGTGKQYQEALGEFWKNFEAEHGSPEGRSLGLINVRYDADVLNTLFYTESEIFITADVIEFY